MGDRLGQLDDVPRADLPEQRALALVGGLQQIGLVQAAGVHHQDARVHRDLPQGGVGVRVADVRDDPLEPGQLVDRPVADGGLEGQRGAQQLTHVRFLDGQHLEPVRVQLDDLLEDLGVLALDDDELAEQAEPDALAHVLQRRRLLEALPGGGQRKLAGIDDGAAEEGPARDDQVVGVGDQHALRVDAVARAVAGSSGVGQHEGQPDHARRRRVDRDDAHRLEPEALPAPGQLLLGGELPRGRPLRDGLGPDPHRDVQQLGEVVGELQARVGVAPAVGAVSRLQADLGAGGRQRVQRVPDGERPVAQPDPAHRGCVRLPGGPRHHLDGVRDQEAGEQADAELPQEVLGSGRGRSASRSCR